VEHRTDFRNAPTMFLHSHKLWHRAREMSRERSRGQSGTIEIGPVEPQELNAPCSHDGFALRTPPTECDERVAQRCGESRAVAVSVQKHERERGLFLPLHNTIGKPGDGLRSASGKTSLALLVQSNNLSVTNLVTGSNPPERVGSQHGMEQVRTRGWFCQRMSGCRRGLAA